jgi:hypothetical protein
MKKTKVYGPANDSDENVQDEILLAELVARCKERGLKTVNGPAYTDADGEQVESSELKPGCRACAMGAALLEPIDLGCVAGWPSLARGHEVGITRREDPQMDSYYRRRGLAIGAAFNDAMDQEPFIAFGFEQV